MKRSMEQWSLTETSDTVELFIVNDPPRVIHEDRVCVAFSCKGMMDVMRRYADSEIALSIDAKHSCMAHGWGVLTASFLVRDQLRNTSLAKIGGKRIQGKAFTSHAAPVLQAIIQVENIENIHQFFITLKRLWAIVCPRRPELEQCVLQVHKDYHPAIEHARRKHFSNQEP